MTEEGRSSYSADFLVLLVVCSILIDHFRCQEEEESAWLALHMCNVCAKFFSLHPFETNTGSS